ncbi:DUF4956 domain-containing protein, partial [Candidatus Pelagibacter ubique]|nr:DUF4956 domain-containing protein [Candidatus Pelagibacter ubique]
MEQNQNTLLNKQQLEAFFLNSNVDINFGNFIISIFLSFFLATIIKFTYMKVSRSLNDKEHFSEIFVPLAIITTLVITVVKFSLALSLGLVGALSIVRFRAAIKEPEELVYLFFVIGVGLAMGANQFLVAIIATVLTVTILFLRKIYTDKNSINAISENSINILQIQTKKDAEKLINYLKKDVKYLNLKSFSSDANLNQYNFWFDIESKNLFHFMKK